LRTYILVAGERAGSFARSALATFNAMRVHSIQISKEEISTSKKQFQREVSVAGKRQSNIPSNSSAWHLPKQQSPKPAFSRDIPVTGGAISGNSSQAVSEAKYSVVWLHPMT
jgi:hypothetical protein